MKNGYEVLKRTTDDRSKCSRSNTDKQRVNNLQTAEEEDAVGTLAGMSWYTGRDELAGMSWYTGRDELVHWLG